MWEYCFMRYGSKKIQVDYYTPSGTKHEAHKLDTKEQKAEFKTWQSNVPHGHVGIHHPESVFLWDKQVTFLLASGWELFLIEGNEHQHIYRRQYEK